MYVTLGSIGYYEKKLPNVKIDKNEPKIINAVGENYPLIIEGIIKKEEIPAELELGDYWYWIHFDEPYLLVNNASGTPMYIEKMQLNPPENAEMYDLEEFLDTKVEVFGYQTWGYAESSVFQVLSLRKI